MFEDLVRLGISIEVLNISALVSFLLGRDLSGLSIYLTAAFSRS
jgi:hypothetical protein